MAVQLGKIVIKPGEVYNLELKKECPVCGLEMRDHEDLSKCFKTIEELEAAGLATPQPNTLMARAGAINLKG